MYFSHYLSTFDFNLSFQYCVLQTFSSELKFRTIKEKTSKFTIHI
jgi:hypothetical protein